MVLTGSYVNAELRKPPLLSSKSQFEKEGQWDEINAIGNNLTSIISYRIILILISDVFHSQVTIEGLCQHYDLNQSEAVSLIYKAVKIARDACDEVSR